jgi:hypothetical protein
LINFPYEWELSRLREREPMRWRKTSQQFNLSLAERWLLQAVTTGELVDLTVGDPGNGDPAGGGTWNASLGLS